MASILKILRVLADPSRLRLLLLLEREELSVAELQEILADGPEPHFDASVAAEDRPDWWKIGALAKTAFIG